MVDLIGNCGDCYGPFLNIMAGHRLETLIFLGNCQCVRDERAPEQTWKPSSTLSRTHGPPLPVLFTPFFQEPSPLATLEFERLKEQTMHYSTCEDDQKGKLEYSWCESMRVDWFIPCVSVRVNALISLLSVYPPQCTMRSIVGGPSTAWWRTDNILLTRFLRYTQNLGLI